MSEYDNHKPQNRKNPPSFLKIFILFQMILLIIVVLWFVYRFNDMQENHTRKKLKNMSQDIEVRFINFSKNIDFIMSYIANDILLHQSNVETVKRILSNKQIANYKNKEDGASFWTTLAWHDAQNNTKHLDSNGNFKNQDGLLKLVELCKSKPWKLHFSRIKSFMPLPDSNIMACIATEDDNRKYIGALVAEISYEKLNDTLLGNWSNITHDYAIFDSHGNSIMKSFYACKKGENAINQYIKKLSKDEKITAHLLSPLSPNNMSSMARPMAGSDFHIISIANHHQVNAKSVIMSIFVSPLVDCLFFATLLIAVILFVWMSFIKPVSRLANAVNNMSKDIRSVAIPDHPSQEINLLSVALRKVLMQKFDLMNANKKLEFLFQKANAASKVKFDFLRNMQHGLRTPLNHIISSTEILLSKSFKPLTKEGCEYVNIIKKSAKELLEMFNRIILISDFNAGRIEINEEIFDIRQLIDSSISYIDHKIRFNELKLTIEIQDDLDGVYFDFDNMNKVLVALLENSIMFNSQNGKIFIRAYTTKQNLVIEVEDTGIGIAKQDLSQITEIFEYAGDIMNKRHNGLGLGLNIVQNITKLHDGTTKIDSQKDFGTKVKMFFDKQRIRALKH